MAWIRLTQDYGSHKAGEKVDFPAVLARELCAEGKAVCGVLLDAHMRYERAVMSYDTPEKETKKTVYPEKYKPETVKEIKAYLDKKGVKYPSQAKKADLLKLL